MSTQFLPPGQLIAGILAAWEAYDQAHPGVLDHLTDHATAQIGNTSGDFLLQGEGITLVGGDGNVVAAGLRAHNDVVQLGNGTDNIGLIGDNNRLTVGSGSDSIALIGNNNQVTTGGGTDIIGYQGEGNTFVLGGGTAVIGASGFTGHATFIASGAINLVVNAMPSDGHDTFQLAGGSAALWLGGLGDRIDLRGAVQATIHNFSGVVDLLPSLGYANGAAAVAALHGDGSGGSLLALAGGGFVDFAGLAPGQLHASDFAVG